ncbi:serine/threonine-protein kinase RIO2-like [Bactrocera neohumeralis]|uniref:serine/threonine-protein kinase RIO2-like n=1 Tax=Bactrocera neohumeralis TaxID=98809 RepID=UPI002166336F|nr:serine/threonine-protein kinase RIO2-like [Bactrocera neohumeralis]
MELVDGTLLNSITVLGDPEKVYRRCLDLMIKLAEQGLIHGDFNEFNLMITEDQRVIMIDFPQMVSTNHKNADELFDRDVQNLANFFQRRFQLSTLWYPTLEKDVVRKGNLDKQVYASGHYTQRHEQDLKALMEVEFARHHKDGKNLSDSEEDDEGNQKGEGRAASASGSGDEWGEEGEEEEENGEGEIDRVDCGVIAIPRASPADGEDEEEADEDRNDDGDGEQSDVESLEEAVAAARRQRGTGRGKTETTSRMGM